MIVLRSSNQARNQWCIYKDNSIAVQDFPFLMTPPVILSESTVSKPGVNTVFYLEEHKVKRSSGGSDRMRRSEIIVKV